MGEYLTRGACRGCPRQSWHWHLHRGCRLRPQAISPPVCPSGTTLARGSLLKCGLVSTEVLRHLVVKYELKSILAKCNLNPLVENNIAFCRGASGCDCDGDSGPSELLIIYTLLRCHLPGP